MTFTSQDIDPKMCTHLIYSFAGLEGNQIVSLDTEEDIENGGYTKVNRVVNFLY
jgi:GH18 family chitinase